MGWGKPSAADGTACTSLKRPAGCLHQLGIVMLVCTLPQRVSCTSRTGSGLSWSPPWIESLSPLSGRSSTHVTASMRAYKLISCKIISSIKCAASSPLLG
jgi:hypothetical protein